MRPVGAGEKYPRGLCWPCWRQPGIRGRYACRPGPEESGLSEAEVLALPPQPFGDEEPAPPPYVPEPEKRQLGDLAAQWAGVGVGGAFDLDESTSPAAIAAAQRKDVAAAAARLRRALNREPTAAEIGDDVILPVWSVERRLAELAEGLRP